MDAEFRSFSRAWWCPMANPTWINLDGFRIKFSFVEDHKQKSRIVNRVHSFETIEKIYFIIEIPTHNKHFNNHALLFIAWHLLQKWIQANSNICGKYTNWWRSHHISQIILVFFKMPTVTNTHMRMQFRSWLMLLKTREMLHLRKDFYVPYVRSDVVELYIGPYLTTRAHPENQEGGGSLVSVGWIYLTFHKPSRRCSIIAKIKQV